ncbi:MAG: hypothetical protein WBF75_12070 [Pseudonocardiaceae bacterium]
MSPAYLAHRTGAALAIADAVRIVTGLSVPLANLTRPPITAFLHTLLRPCPVTGLWVDPARATPSYRTAVGAVQSLLLADRYAEGNIPPHRPGPHRPPVVSADPISFPREDRSVIAAKPGERVPHRIR